MFLLKLLRKTNESFSCVEELARSYPSLKIKDRSIPVVFCIRKNAKNLRLRISRDCTQAILLLPPKTSVSEARDFFAQCELWAASRSFPLINKVLFEEGAKIPILGLLRTLYFKNDLRVNFILEQDRLLVHENLKFNPSAIRLFLKQVAYDYISKKSHEYSKILNVHYGKITLKNYRARWGSCSSKGDLTYSWRLVFAPPHVINYLCAHEVSHLKEMNHSYRFWSCVSLLIPDYKPAKRWLKENGSTLFLYG